MTTSKAKAQGKHSKRNKTSKITSKNIDKESSYLIFHDQLASRITACIQKRRRKLTSVLQIRKETECEKKKYAAQRETAHLKKNPDESEAEMNEREGKRRINIDAQTLTRKGSLMGLKLKAEFMAHLPNWMDFWHLNQLIVQFFNSESDVYL